MRLCTARSVAPTLLLLMAACSHKAWAAEGVGEAANDGGMPVGGGTAGFGDAAADVGRGHGDDASCDLVDTEDPESRNTAKIPEQKAQPVAKGTGPHSLRDQTLEARTAAQPGEEFNPSVTSAVASGDSSYTPHLQTRLPIFGFGADVGLPDGANVSLVVRPLKWARFQVAVGSNSISRGVRIGTSLVPLRDGPGVVVEYGHYWDGNANRLVARLAGDDFRSSPMLDRVGYDYFNLHLGLNFGHRRMTFFVQGGLSVVRGHLNRTDPTAYGSDHVQMAVLDNPRFRSIGVAGKLGLLVYVW